MDKNLKSQPVSPQNNFIFIPTEIEKVENRGCSMNSEQISLFIIDKLISLTLTEVSRRETNKIIPKKCFSYITNMIQNFLKLEFLPHDRDDLHINNQEVFISRPYSRDTNEINKIKNFIGQGEKNILIDEIKTENNLDKELNSSLSPTDSSIGKDSSKTIPLNDSKLDYFMNNENKIKGEIFMDNYISGFNDWTIMDEPVGIFYFFIKIYL